MDEVHLDTEEVPRAIPVGGVILVVHALPVVGDLGKPVLPALDIRQDLGVPEGVMGDQILDRPSCRRAPSRPGAPLLPGPTLTTTASRPCPDAQSMRWTYQAVPVEVGWLRSSQASMSGLCLSQCSPDRDISRSVGFCQQLDQPIPGGRNFVQDLVPGLTRSRQRLLSVDHVFLALVFLKSRPAASASRRAIRTSSQYAR